MAIEKRLIQEINRLGYSSESFSKAVGVTERTQYNYEHGVRSPKTEYWQKAADLGMDIQYVITGIPKLGINVQSKESSSTKPDNLIGNLESVLERSKQQVAEIEHVLKIVNDIAKKTGV